MRTFGPLFLVFSLLPPSSDAMQQGSGPIQGEPSRDATEDESIELEHLRVAARVSGDAFEDDQLELMLADVRERLEGFERLRGRPLENALEPALCFLPTRAQHVGPDPVRASRLALRGVPVPKRPEDLEALAYADIRTLHAHLIHRVVSCEELVDLFLARLVRVDEELRCVVNLTEERARAQARQLDAELAAGHSRGLLHGIPWVAKDLLAVRGTPTTWGARPYAEQVIDADACVVQRLDAAGAVLIAKVSLGALAWGDVWFGGRTNNPWNTRQGSSGSSAGPAAAVAAGAAVFGIGSETLGSIVSPSDRCGNTSLRPTFGRIPRTGAMTLAWSMDKLGPMCRTAGDTAILLDALHGADAGDPGAVSLPFDLADSLGAEVQGLRVGFVREHFEPEGTPRREAHVLEELEALGIELVELELPDFPVGDMTFVLAAEAASAFEDFSRAGLADQLVRQERHAWPNVFRHARLIPAVDYLRATRLRTQLSAAWQETLAGVAALVHPSFAGDVLSATNLSGHPTFVAPCGFRDDGTPFSVSFTGRLYGETELLALACAWQASTDHHLPHPD